MNNGYIEKIAKNHPSANSAGYVMEHRLVMEYKIGRYLKPSEYVHHINHIRTENRPENLILCNSMKEHNQYHRGHRIEIDLTECTNLKEQGLSIKQIANKLGVNFNTLKKRLHLNRISKIS